jgi:hypothetical protein
VPRAMFLQSLVRGGMVEMQRSRERKRNMGAGGARGRIRAEVEANVCAAQRKGKMRHRVRIYSWKMMRLNHWMKRRRSWTLHVVVR